MSCCFGGSNERDSEPAYQQATRPPESIAAHQAHSTAPHSSTEQIVYEADPYSDDVVNKPPEAVEYSVPDKNTFGNFGSHAAAGSGREVYTNAPVILDCMIVPYESVTMQEKIDGGQFGAVFAGTLKHPNGNVENVAIKMLKVDQSTVTDQQRTEFMREMATMAQLQHNFVLRQLAVVESPLMIVMERVKEKSLLSYLKGRGHNSVSPIAYPTLLRFAYQTAQGLAYLADHTIVHRDIAARNVLLQVMSRSNFQCKVADFGLARVMENLTYAHQRGKPLKVPARWTAPEALFAGKFSTKSDVWAWGVMIWELTTCGQFPYTAYWDDVTCVKLVATQNLRLHQAEMVPTVLYEIMFSCWEYEPRDRPNFSKLSQRLAGLEAALLENSRQVPPGFKALSRQEVQIVHRHDVTQQPIEADCFVQYSCPEMPIFEKVENAANVPLKELYRMFIRENETPSYFKQKSPWIQSIEDKLLPGELYRRTMRATQVSLTAVGPTDLIPEELPLMRKSQNVDSSSAIDYAIYDNLGSRSITSYSSSVAYESVLYGQVVDDVDSDDQLSDIYGTRVVYTTKGDYATNEFVEYTVDDPDMIPGGTKVPGYQNVLGSEDGYGTAQKAPPEDLIAKIRQREEEEDTERFPPGCNANERQQVRQWLESGSDRQAAESAIREYGPKRGTYVARQKKGEFILDVCNGSDGKVFHFRLKNVAEDPDSETTLLDPNRGNVTFKSLWALLAFYKETDPRTLKSSLGAVQLKEVVPPP